MQQILLLEEESKVSDYNYLSIKNSIIDWYNEQFSEQDNVSISKDTVDILIIDFDFNECLAQLTVSKRSRPATGRRPPVGR